MTCHLPVSILIAMGMSRGAASMPWTIDDDAHTVLAAMAERRERHRREVGRRVLRFRKAKGWNHEDLAHEAHLSVSTISRIERGKHDAYGATIKQVATALGVEVDALHPPLLDAEADHPLREQLERIEEKLDALLAAVATPPAVDAATLRSVLEQAAQRADEAREKRPEGPRRTGRKGRAA